MGINKIKRVEVSKLRRSKQDICTSSFPTRENWWIRGFCANRNMGNKMDISHLLYADDSLVFLWSWSYTNKAFESYLYQFWRRFKAPCLLPEKLSLPSQPSAWYADPSREPRVSSGFPTYLIPRYASRSKEQEVASVEWDFAKTEQNRE